jgi:hypothetical protein
LCGEIVSTGETYGRRRHPIHSELGHTLGRKQRLVLYVIHIKTNNIWWS